MQAKQLNGSLQVSLGLSLCRPGFLDHALRLEQRRRGEGKPDTLTHGGTRRCTHLCLLGSQRFQVGGSLGGKLGGSRLQGRPTTTPRRHRPGPKRAGTGQPRTHLQQSLELRTLPVRGGTQRFLLKQPLLRLASDVMEGGTA